MHPTAKSVPGRGLRGRRVSLLLIAVMIHSVAAAADGATPVLTETAGAALNPWAFSLNLYTWLAGVDGDFSAGRLDKSVDKNFIDIVDASHSFPLGFMGRFEANYERFGLYLDGNWFQLDFKSKTGPRGRSNMALDTGIGIMDYGVMYRVSGPPDLANWNGSSEPYRLDVYLGARTIWLDNTITPQRLRSASGSSTLTSPMLGGRIFIDFSRDWFVKIDGNVGGFGVDNVHFTGGILGSLGYNATVFDLPTTFELGYKALNMNVNGDSASANATLNGPFVGLTGYW